jgi:hypothetical protein
MTHRKTFEERKTTQVRVVMDEHGATDRRCLRRQTLKLLGSLLVHTVKLRIFFEKFFLATVYRFVACHFILVVFILPFENVNLLAPLSLSSTVIDATPPTNT